MNEIYQLVEKMRASCFFCSKLINEKKSLEHIIPDSLLGKLGLKEQLVDGVSSFQYSRVKVPAHKTCNNEFGSTYENKLLNLFSNTDKLFEELKSEENELPSEYQPNNSPTILISTWLSKVYYGLYYHDFLKVDNNEFREKTRNIIDADNFKMIQSAYKDGVGFCLPSSLFVFKSKNDFFDLQTFIYPQTILMKINTLIMILCIEDGFLTKKYLNSEILNSFREKLEAEEINNNFPLHLYALSEIMALRISIPKSPSFIYSDKKIANMSFFTLAQNPNEYYKVDGKEVAEIRNKILGGLIARIEKKHTK